VNNGESVHILMRS